MKRSLPVITLLAAGVFWTGCAGPLAHRPAQPARRTHELLNIALWKQSSAEYSALARQCYRQAAMSLDRALDDRTLSALPVQERRGASAYADLPPAVILDLDETVLDNTPFSARLARAGSGFDRAVWDRWCQEGAAPEVPGAPEFIRYAESRGVAVFYVTNRSHIHEEATRGNLARLGLDPGAEPDRALFRGEQAWTRDKDARRLAVARTHRVLLLVGDDLGDFTSVSGLSVDDRSRVVSAHGQRWGTQWIVLPNPAYGSWLSALVDLESPDDEEDMRRRFERLRTSP